MKREAKAEAEKQTVNEANAAMELLMDVEQQIVRDPEYARNKEKKEALHDVREGLRSFRRAIRKIYKLPENQK